jgi:hypothetical protein
VASHTAEVRPVAFLVMIKIYGQPTAQIRDFIKTHQHFSLNSRAFIFPCMKRKENRIKIEQNIRV